MMWSRAGVVYGQTEEVRDGYVIHSEGEGIWASWFGYDHESGIQAFYAAVGTSAGGLPTFTWYHFLVKFRLKSIHILLKLSTYFRWYTNSGIP